MYKRQVLDKLENVEILWDTVAEAIKGNSEVETLQIKNQKTQEKRELSVDGVFVAVGAVPNTKEFQNLIQLDEAGYIACLLYTSRRKSGTGISCNPYLPDPDRNFQDTASCAVSCKCLWKSCDYVPDDYKSLGSKTN